MGIIVCGLNGVGKSTIGKSLAERLEYSFIDNEDLFFSKSEPGYPFMAPRSKSEVIQLLNEMIDKNSHFVFASVKGDYGDKLISSLDYAVLVEAPRQIRMQRVRERSFSKFGKRILYGGDLYEKEMSWFDLVESRPEDYVLQWIEHINCPVIRLDGTQSIEDNVDYLLSIIMN